LANVAAKLAGGDPISPDVMADHAVTTSPLGLGNAAQHARHLMSWRVTTGLGGVELVGMLGFVSESDDDVLATDLTGIEVIGTLKLPG
jgi:hypothetical protein